MPTDACRATLVGAAREVPGPQPLPPSAVQGELPGWLRGALVANGGGDYDGMLHLFDGLASVVRVGLNEGGGGDGDGSKSIATFAQRMLRTQARERKAATGKVAYREFATSPPVDPPGLAGEARALFSQLAQLASGSPQFTDNASVNLIPVEVPAAGGRPLLLAVSETPGASYLVDARTLETVRHAAPDAEADGVPGMLTTAHPARLRGGRELVNFTRTLPFGGMHVYRMASSGRDALKREAVAFIPDRRKMSPTWVHDFAATDDGYAVIVEPPLYMNLASLMIGGDRQRKGGIVPGASDFVFMDWRPEDGVRVAVVPLPAAAAAGEEEEGEGEGAEKAAAAPAIPKQQQQQQKKTLYFLVPQAFFAFHFGNCFLVKADAATGGGPQLCVDVAAYDDPAILNDLRLAPLLAGGRPLGERRGGHGPGGRSGEVSRSRYARLTIPLDRGSTDPSSPAPLAPPVPLTRPDAPDADFAEFPTLNPRFRGRADSRYAYVLNAVRPTNMGNALAKLDLATGESKTWREPGGAPGEPVFVPRGAAEGGTGAEDDGVVLAFVAAPEGGSFVVVLDAREWREVARVRLPAGVPYRFHGGWMPAAAAAAGGGA